MALSQKMLIYILSAACAIGLLQNGCGHTSPQNAQLARSAVCLSVFVCQCMDKRVGWVKMERERSVPATSKQYGRLWNKITSCFLMFLLKKNQGKTEVSIVHDISWKGVNLKTTPPSWWKCGSIALVRLMQWGKKDLSLLCATARMVLFIRFFYLLDLLHCHVHSAGWARPLCRLGASIPRQTLSTCVPYNVQNRHASNTENDPPTEMQYVLYPFNPMGAFPNFGGVV